MSQHTHLDFPNLKQRRSIRPARAIPLPDAVALWRSASALILLAFVFSSPARAIPSPDVVISLFASAAQVLGVTTVILGRWFFVRRGQGLSAGRAKGSNFAVPFLVTTGLFLASLIGWGFFYLHIQDQRMARLQINLVRSSTENGKLVGDVNLKTLSFSEQKKREDGFSTEQLQEWIDKGEVKEPMFDIRETEEVEMGAIAGTRHMRYPDLLRNPGNYLEPGSPVILLCFNGNRSSETADALRLLGYKPRFMIGGYEKWSAEERPLDMKDGHVPQDLREIPEYVNKEVLLDTDEVTRLVNEENALFLDVRYPGEYEVQGHLPDARNLTMRSMTSPELDTALAAVPKRPLIGVCYDKRGSFYALVIGLRLTRLGYDWRGRYTVPEEYFVPAKDKAHVLAWQEAHKGKSLLTAVSEPLQSGLDFLQEKSGSLALAILGLVLALRFGLFPFTWKAERDRLEQRRLAPAIAGLKQAYGDDRAGAARATMALMREHKIRLFLNLIGTSAQLLLFLAFFSVIARASESNETEGFLWIPLLSGSDPWRALPIAISLLVIVQLALSAKKRTILLASFWVMAAGGLYLLVASASGGVLLYLTANLALMVAHTLAARAWFGRDAALRQRERATKFQTAPLVPLEFAHLVDGAGKKAARLGELMAAGLPVPRGFAVRASSVEHFLSHGAWKPEHLAAIRAAHARLGSELVAVRSSGANEDGAQASYAGIYESVLNVTTDKLLEALSEVANSQRSERAKAYASANEGADRLGIVVQAMVPAEYAGVLFTEHPGESGAMLVELVAGLGEELVSGRAQPTSHRYGRASGELLDPLSPPIAVEHLIALGSRVEALFGCPQDVEWAYAGGRFSLLQARDITRTSRSASDARALREAERARLLALARGCGPDEILLAQNELSELLPQPTPYSLALMEQLWAHGGSTDLACRELSVPYCVRPDSAPFAVSVFGRLYVNRAEERSRLAKGPGSLAIFRLARGAELLERRFREEFLPGFLRRSRLDLAVDLSLLSAPELADLHRERRALFVRETYVQAELVNVAADILFKTAMRALEKHGLDPAQHLAHVPRTVVDEALEMLGEIGRGTRGRADFLALHGHRSTLDYELSAPRYCEDPALVETMAARSAKSIPHSQRAAPTLPGSKVLELTVDRARRFASLKEEAKHHALRDLAFLRCILVELGARSGLGERIFQLTPDEVDRLDTPALTLLSARELARERAELAQALLDLELPSELTPRALETLDVERGQRMLPRAGRSRLSGTRVSGPGGVCGNVRVLRSPDDIGTLLPGEILVARFTDPAWTPVFPLCGGIITEVGGWLSHAAILAREHGITAIVGTQGALVSLTTGDLVRLGEDGSVELFTERRLELRHKLELEVLLRRSGGELGGALSDVSRFGARLTLHAGSLGIGERVEMSAHGGTLVREALVVRNGIPGIYGISFEKEVGAGDM
ncbi:MAG: PEP/pyruvate-binding domain-containing protein [Planctomycetota bacterium]